jgi:hypothetical protein
LESGNLANLRIGPPIRLKAPGRFNRAAGTHAAGLLENHAIRLSSGKIVFMEDKPLLPGQWIDDLPEPLETVADVEELFRMVDTLKAKRLAEAIRKAALN